MRTPSAFALASVLSLVSVPASAQSLDLQRTVSGVEDDSTESQIDPATGHGIRIGSLALPADLFSSAGTRTTSGSGAPHQWWIPAASQTAPQKPAATRFEPASWSKVTLYGLQLTFYEHVMRVATQDFTREQLKGKFWPEYFDSIGVPDHWGDKDGWEVNYLGHAISGGAFTRIWMDQREGPFTTKAAYARSLGRALIYTDVFSVQYEIGPMSEASIGNVGLNRKDLGWSDYIWTPLGGVLWTVGEDLIDRYALTYIDKHVPFLMARAAARMILNPSRMLANIGQNRAPWSRPPARGPDK